MKDKHEKIQTKIFIGYRLVLDMRMALNESQSWKEAQLLKGSNPDPQLELVKHNGKEYVGFFLPYALLPIAELRAAKERLRQLFQRYETGIDADRLSPVLFSQPFVK